MTRSRLILSLVSVFVLGNLSGIILAKRLSKRMLSAKNQAASLDRHFKEDARRLALRPEQEPQVRECYASFAADLQSIRRDASIKARDSFNTHAGRVGALLDPSQSERFSKLNQERLARWKSLKE